MRLPDFKNSFTGTGETSEESFLEKQDWSFVRKYGELNKLRTIREAEKKGNRNKKKKTTKRKRAKTRKNHKKQKPKNTKRKSKINGKKNKKEKNDAMGKPNKVIDRKSKNKYKKSKTKRRKPIKNEKQTRQETCSETVSDACIVVSKTLETIMMETIIYFFIRMPSLQWGLKKIK